MADNLLDRIARETDLTKSERKLASVILKDPALVINENIAQLAKRASVSEPSVCRFCKRFGADGFPAFKLVLSSLVSSDSKRKAESVKQGDTVEDVISKVIATAKSTVSSLDRSIDEGIVARVIDVVSQSRRVIVIAQGLSSFVAHEFSSRMLSFGFPCECYTDRQSMAMAIASMHSGDVVIAVSASGMNKDLIEALDFIKNTGGVSVAIAPFNTPLSALCTLSLNSGDPIGLNSDEPLGARISLMLLSQIILGGVILRRGIAISDIKDRMKKAKASAYFGDEEDKDDTAQGELDDGLVKPGAPITTLDWHY